MASKIKALGLALVAVLALSAVAASAAQAVTHEVEIPKGSAEIRATQENGSGIENYLEIEGSHAKVECTEAHYTGNVENGDKAITVHPEYTGCYAPGLSPEHGSIPIDTEGCNFVLDGTTAGEHAEVHIECEANKKIQITAPACTINIGEQTPTEGGVHYNNEETEGSPMEVTIEATVTGIHYHAEGALCFLIFSEATKVEEGTYTGDDSNFVSSITAKAYETGGGSQIDFTLNPGA